MRLMSRRVPSIRCSHRTIRASCGQLVGIGGRSRAAEQQKTPMTTTASHAVPHRAPPGRAHVQSRSPLRRAAEALSTRGRGRLLSSRGREAVTGRSHRRGGTRRSRRTRPAAPPTVDTRRGPRRTRTGEAKPCPRRRLRFRRRARPRTASDGSNAEPPAEGDEDGHATAAATGPRDQRVPARRRRRTARPRTPSRRAVAAMPPPTRTTTADQPEDSGRLADADQHRDPEPRPAGACRDRGEPRRVADASLQPQAVAPGRAATARAAPRRAASNRSRSFGLVVNTHRLNGIRRARGSTLLRSPWISRNSW